MTAVSCNPFLTKKRFFFASKLYVWETILEPRFEILSPDVFLCSASFFCEDLLFIRIEKG